MEKHCIILNPVAGRGYAGKQRPVLEKALRQQGIAFDLMPTSLARGVSQQVRQALAQGYRRVVAVGGDGTIHEVASAILQHTEEGSHSVTLGIVPIGTGSDFIKSLEGFQPNDIPGSVARLARGHTRRIDAGRVQVTTAAQKVTHFFVNNLALGIDALVAAETNNVRYVRGLAAYMVGAMRALLAYTAQPMSVRFDNTEMQQPFLLATVTIGRCQGGGFWLTPDALLDDGLFDLCLVDNLRPDQIVRYLPRAMQGTHTRLPRVHMARASRVEVVYSTPALIVTDGEVIATDAQRLEVDIVQQMLEIIV
jgi:YegS/Rv2252/BmrU family lipid kinase